MKAMAIQAANHALADAGLDRKEIEALYVGNFISGVLTGQETIAPQIGDLLGLRKDIPCTKVEGACCSGGIALRHAYSLIASDQAQFVLAIGVEKMTHASTEKNTEGLATAMDHDSEGRTGLTFPGFFALVAKRHMHEFGTTAEHLALVSLKNHDNSVNNPRARFRNKVAIEKIRESKLVADPLRIYDCCPISDGAAAVVLCSTEIARRFNPNPVEIIGTAQSTGYTTLYDTPNPVTLDATVIAGKKAFAMAGIVPADVDVVELHDCFTIAEIVATEGLGLFEPGAGGRAVEEGLTSLGGKIPVNVSGGLKAKGHPIGATGAAQVAEIVTQLRGEAGPRQVEGARRGLAHTLGGNTATVCVSLFGRD